MSIEQAKERLKSIVDFYKLNDENNYDYSDDVLISIRIVLEEIERLNNIIKKIEKMFNHETLIKYYYGMSYEFEINDFKDDIFEIIKGSDKE